MTFKHTALILISVLVFQSCTTSPVVAKPESKSQASEVKSEKEKEPLSPKFYALLKSSRVPVQKAKYSEFIKGSELYCKVMMPDGNRTCTFKVGTKKYTVPTKESEELASLLFGLKISQGDSGVETSYFECHQYKGATDVGCDVAMPLDYQGP